MPGSAVEISYSDASGSLTLRAQMASHNMATGQFDASGDVRIWYDGSTLEADVVRGNFLTRELSAVRAKGQINSLRIWGEEITTRRRAVRPRRTPGGYQLEYKVRNGSVTTCDLPKPDFQVTAREITVEPGDHATARKVSLFLGRFKVFTAPVLRIGLGPEWERETLLPKPGYDSRDGPFLGIGYGLVRSARTNVSLNVRATSRGGVQGGLLLRQVIAGEAMSTEDVAELDLASRPLLVPGPGAADGVGLMTPQVQEPSPNVTGYVRLAHRERVYDVDNRDLLLDSSPEVGFRWTSPTFHLAPGGKLSGYAVGTASWGKFREIAGNEDKRTDLRLTLAALPARVSARTYVQPALLVRRSSYNTGGSFSSRGVSVDITRTFGNSYVSARYLSNSSTGTTPFEFDDVDRPRQLQGAFGHRWTRNTVNVVLRYALNDGGLYDWEVSYARKLHCLEPKLTWRNRFGLFSIDVKVLGLD